MKLKSTILILSILILLFTNIVRTNFFSEPEYIRWRQLTWDDFQGMKIPFSSFSAGILSVIRLEYDSLLNKNYAFAYSNINSSYKSSDSNGVNDLLRHEQYHFNITEAHARMLNDYIDRGHTESEVRNVLYEIRSMKNAMQDKYDRETDHSLLKSMQKRWEYKIDSMLLHYDTLDSYHYDTHSNYRIFFPNKTSHEYKGNYSGDYMAERSFQFNHYDMVFVSSSYFVGKSNSAESFYNYLMGYVNLEGIIINNFEFDTLNSNYTARINSLDTLNKEHRIMDVTYKLGYLYKRDVYYPDKEDSIGYIQNANSFLGSFELRSANTELNIACGENSISKTSNKLEKYDKNESGGCLVLKNYGSHNYFAKPVILDSGYYFHFDPMTHADSLISESFLIYDEGIYYNEEECQDKIFYLDDVELKDSVFLTIGYTIKEDTSKACLEAYCQEVILTEFDL
ncbi:hypothetical protein [Marivirga sp.]|uniref:hypothetical protein n=1 Tax=Marivirga sp. TaxID=2018662 RepID=UPI003DA77C8E